LTTQALRLDSAPSMRSGASHEAEGKMVQSGRVGWEKQLFIGGGGIFPAHAGNIAGFFGGIAKPKACASASQNWHHQRRITRIVP
jgi:hypothetical protein